MVTLSLEATSATPTALDFATEVGTAPATWPVEVNSRVSRSPTWNVLRSCTALGSTVNGVPSTVMVEGAAVLG